VPTIEQLLGPLGLTIAAVFAVAYLGRAATKWVMDLWHEHLRVDHERQVALVRSNERNDALRESNDANAKVMDRAVAQNERLVAAVLKAERLGDN
jgi:hypothetical protein